MNELDWLTENRPEPSEPDTAWARASLLAHIEAETGDCEFATPNRAERALVAAAADELAAATRLRRAPRRAPRRAAAVAVLALSLLAAMVAWPTGEVRTPPVPGLHAPAPAEAALVTLSKRIAQEPAPTGDATLVVREHHYPGEKDKDINAYDLYLDDGRYIFSQTEAGLKDAPVNGDYNRRLVKAAVAARTLPTAQARLRDDPGVRGQAGGPAQGPGRLPPGQLHLGQRHRRAAGRRGPQGRPRGRDAAAGDAQERHGHPGRRTR